MKTLHTIAFFIGVALMSVLILAGAHQLGLPGLQNGLIGIELLGVGGFLAGFLGLAVTNEATLFFIFPRAICMVAFWLFKRWMHWGRPGPLRDERNQRLIEAYRWLSSKTLFVAFLTPWLFLAVSIIGAVLYCGSLFCSTFVH